MAKTQASSRSNVGGQHSFAMIPSQSLPRSAFNRSAGLKTTFDGGYLVPIFADEALPGDTISMRTSTFGRMATPLHPIMDNLHQDLFFFAVPMRLIWDNWQRFMGEQDNPDDTTDYLIPTMTSPGPTGYDVGSLSDYLGLPIGQPNIPHSSMWHRAASLIWNEWFRDENLQDSVVVDKDDGPDDPTDYVLMKRGKRHDYFTSSLPFPLKSDPVQLPIGSIAPVISDVGQGGTGIPGFVAGGEEGRMFRTAGGSPAGNMYMVQTGGDQSGGLVWGTDTPLTGAYNPALVADLSSATSSTINEIRQAFQLQKLYERDARGGSRYTEILRSHFGVLSPDARLQRPEYLGGGSTRINVNPVANTTSFDTGGGELGQLAAFVTFSSSGNMWTKSFTEHCVVLGFVNVRADLNYQQGLDRMFSRSTRLDFYWPSFAHLGEQAILNKEIWARNPSMEPDQDAVFGYQERYAEYRYKQSKVTGQMRSDAALSLDTWHLSQDFGDVQPVLNDAFIQDAPPIDRVVAVPAEPDFLFDAHFEFKHVRPMPVFGVPGFVDHF